MKSYLAIEDLVYGGMDHAVWREREILCTAWASPDRVDETLALVADDDWSVERHRVIAQAMRAVHARGEAIDVVSMRAELNGDGCLERIGGMRALGELGDSIGDAPSVIAAYARAVREAALIRRLDAEWSAGAADARSGFGIAVAARTRRIEALCLEIDSLGRAPRAVGADKVAALVESIRSPAARPTISTGLPAVDERLDGGLMPGWLVVLLGPPKMGKTALAVNGLGVAAMRQGLPMLYAGEMSEDELMARWLASESGVSLRAQRSGVLTATQWSDVNQAADVIATWMWECHPVVSLARIEADARAFAAAHGRLGMLIVDYLQLVSNGNDNRVVDLEHTTRGLKLLARELDCPIVVLSQPTNEAAKAKSELGLFDGKGAGSIAADCDLLLVINRDREHPDRAGITAPGYRHGEAFALPMGSLRFDGSRMRFE